MGTLYRHDIIDIDIAKPLQRTSAGVLIATGDKEANVFGATVYDGGAAASLTGCKVQGYFIRGNGNTVVLTGAVAGNKATVTLSTACYLYSGSFALAIKLTNGSMTHTLRVIDGYIRATSTDSIVDPDHIIPSLDDLLAQIGAMQTATAAANTATSAANTATGKANTATTAANTATGKANTATSAANTAAGSATAAATSATSAASAANTAASSVNTAKTAATNAAAAANASAAKIDNMTVSSTTGAAGTQAAAVVSDVSGHKHIAFTIPRGMDGAGNVNKVNGIAPSSGNVTLTGENILITSGGAKVSDGINDALSKAGRNLLINANFLNPVNQRGKTSYSGSGYTIDRWRIPASCALNVVSAGVKFTNSVASNGFRQPVSDCERLAGKTMTLTFKAASSSVLMRAYANGTDFSTVYGNADKVTSTVTFTFPASASDLQVGIVLSSDASAKTIIQAKLEIGSVSTLANDPPIDDYATELLKCQRYYCRFSAGYPIAGYGYTTKHNEAKLCLILPTAMRLNPPTLVADATKLGIIVNGAYKNMTSVSMQSVGDLNNAVRLIATFADNSFPDQVTPCVLYADEGFELNAETA